MKLYTCYTDRGKWDFEAYNDKDAIRLALYYCWQWGEDFIKIEGRKGFVPYTLTSAKSTNPTSPPSTSKPKLALHSINLTFASCRATVFALRILHNLFFLYNFVI